MEEREREAGAHTKWSGVSRVCVCGGVRVRVDESAAEKHISTWMVSSTIFARSTGLKGLSDTEEKTDDFGLNENGIDSFTCIARRGCGFIQVYSWCEVQQQHMNGGKGPSNMSDQYGPEEEEEEEEEVGGGGEEGIRIP
jgi:hypothetical protein